MWTTSPRTPTTVGGLITFESDEGDSRSIHVYLSRWQTTEETYPPMGALHTDTDIIRFADPADIRKFCAAWLAVADELEASLGSPV